MASEIQNRDPILEMFLFESVQLIEQLEEQLLDIERNQHLTAAHVDAIFRIMHTIKGSSAMMEFDTLAKLAHALEDLFEKYRSQPDMGVNCGQLADLVLKAVDFCKGEIAKIERGEPLDGQPDDLITQIRTFYTDAVVTESLAGTWTQPERYQARLWFEPGCAMENLRAFSAIHSLTPLTEELTYVPADIADNEDSSSLIREQGFLIRFTSAAEPSVCSPRWNRLYFWSASNSKRCSSPNPCATQTGQVKSQPSHRIWWKISDGQQPDQCSGAQTRPADGSGRRAGDFRSHGDQKS